jgi:hypothetical protein
MKKRTFFKIATVALLSFSAFSILMVSIMAFMNPQSVMDLVQVQLPNNDAFSSIRGVYGGVGVTITTVIIYTLFKSRKTGLAFIALLWGTYAVSRLITIAVEGSLGDFGQQWLMIESSLCLMSLVLLLFYPEQTPETDGR